MAPAEVTVVAEFPQHYFLENLAVRADGSILVTAMNQRELWYVAPPVDDADLPVTPHLMHTFPQPVMAVVETASEVFHVSTSDVYSTHESRLNRVDLRGWAPGEPITPTVVLEFDERAGALNGACLIAPTVMLLPDSLSGLIWRVDLPTADRGAPADRGATADVWLRHPSMNYDPDSGMTPVQPGINGIRYAPATATVYYTCTAQKLFMRVRVDPDTCAPVSEPEQIGGGTMADDFCLDEDAGVAYLTTHRENTVDRVDLDGPADQARVSVAGDPLDERLLGPSSAAWGRAPADDGRVAYVTSDGGTTNPLPDGTVRTAKLLRLDLPPG